ncbi:DNA-binding protein c1d [Aspergillus niger]|uniref:Exosome complex protein n=4 Tax=Aspergillus subgen. Circumdati TaxID=2720871 RepID=A5ABP5_ASPNC|nr:uncharacterized protein An11g09960 [Aspergillus niger]XP_025449586.1 uncharacterized protein BO96DRAFT_349831 [Aspergillus niger CBS 101883]XP_026624414.1 Sas10/Utp3/C1D family-domain-containing protein [Aspergillus welwitschiae]RDH17419.1 hypothetical protein M747DRAFT_284874 [Aspergillus niger ATCC 13496]KAI2812048.1 hypothetical protein CBS115989_10845 [Aspergillus niger]KAI2847543.1 hypothetical protein CBS11350_3069 [Aspergillus niger]KAI2847708.1 hypothetical protein CBS11232_7053 [A
MEAADLLPLLEQLDDNIDDLEEALKPILDSSVVETSKKLPVMDKAKFHVLVTYALESLIFSYLRLHGVNAKEHSVFRELTRVKQYFAKITALEAEPEKRTLTLDKQAASRFIKHGLAGNDKIDLARKEQEAKERARAQLKASILAKKAGATSQQSSQNATSNSESESESEELVKPAPKPSSKGSDDKKKRKDKQKRRVSKEEHNENKKERRKKKDELRKTKKLK